MDEKCWKREGDRLEFDVVIPHRVEVVRDDLGAQFVTAKNLQIGRVRWSLWREKGELVLTSLGSADRTRYGSEPPPKS
jgi:hypothetical protein